MLRPDKEFYIFVYLPGTVEAVPAAIVRLDDEGRLSGSYGRLYSQRREAVPVDPVSMPLAFPSFALEPGRMGAVRDAAPDLWGRLVIARALGRNAEELHERDYLLFSNAARTGNLDFRTSLKDGEPESEPPLSSDADILLDAAENLERERPVAPQYMELLAQGSSMGGSRPKSAMLHDGILWIAKFPAKGDKWSNARVEKSSMELAADCGIDVPELRLLDVEGRDVLLVRRFDREPVPGGFARRGYLSALSLCRWTELERAAYSYEAIADSATAMGVKNLPQLFRRMAFNVLCRNTDDHPRNHGFHANGHSLVLAPAFDIVPSASTYGVGMHVTHAMNIGNAGRLGSVANVLSCAPRFGLTRVQAEDVLAGMLATIAQWRESFERNGVREDETERFRWSFEHWESDPEAQALLDRRGAALR